MSFISPEFVIFAALVLPLFFGTGQRWRWLFLLAASYFFYAYGGVQYLPLIVLVTLVNYSAARLIPLRPGRGWRVGWLVFAMSVSLGILFTFKYLDFFNGTAGFVLGYQAQSINLILPIGISFYTFQAMSYSIDVFRGHAAPEPHLGRVATFIAFFPQLVAGPIERATNLLPQFREMQRFDAARAVDGLRLILWGFFKKVVIADRLAIYVNAVYNDVQAHSGLTLWIATFFFAFQIYCDFSAYSDIAIGTARILGFRLMENFRQPYLARSVREFWGRWHISLSTWFRDYVYIPLGGNRVSLRRNLLNLMIVFLLSGLWHGAGWTFIFWGGLHGLAVALLALTQARGWRMLPSGRAGALLGGLLTFAFVTFTWIFFRANSFSDAQHILANLFTWDASADLSAPLAAGLLGAQTEFALAFALIGLLMLVDWWISRSSLEQALARLPGGLRWATYYALGAAVVFSGLYGSGAQLFIYFQF